jgi:post-segregation antitoxin (ccd killing protein)
MRTTIFLPDDLHEAARRMKVNVSDVCQRAVRDAIVNRKQELQATIDAGQVAQQLLQELAEPGEGLTDRLLDGTQAR